MERQCDVLCEGATEFLYKIETNFMLQRVDMKILLLRLSTILLQYMAVYKLFIWSFGQYDKELT
jgi:hypothetical protein